MKRGKDEEKNMGPMFPRLHVNDTEKGGPRAPPRNKMALYEQLSTPSQRFGGGGMSANPNSTPNHAPPPSSSSQGGVSERGSFFPLQRPSSMNAADKVSNRYSDLNNPLVQNEQKKKPEEDDFRVPIFVQQSEMGLDRSGNHQNGDREGPSPFGLGFSGLVANVQNASERNLSRELAKSASKVHLKVTDGSSSFGHRTGSNNSISLQGNVNLRDHVVDSQTDNNMWGVSGSNGAIRATGYGNSSMNVTDIQQEVLRSPNDPTNGDAVSENSMVDSISGVDISPDDVVGVIGQKHFWKARRAIVNQQRVFAVQVFELHRLIKVQRLIAGSPHLMVEDEPFLRKPTKVSPIKKIPLEYVLKSSPNVLKLKDYGEKPIENTREFTAENAVEKASFSSVQNSGQAMFSGYPFPPVSSWGLNQPPGGGHQWLIPVMSPSEGLVYKPYPGPGYMSLGPGPPGPAPVFGHNFLNYGPPPPPPQPHCQWPGGFHPLVPPAAHGYFPPYSIPPVNHPSGGESVNPFTMQHEGSDNVPIATRFHGSNESEVQLSTASSPNDNARDRNALPLFPTCPPAEGGPQQTRVIRVVPHNARLTTESVARIFQSIQEERKQHDSV